MHAACLPRLLATIASVRRSSRSRSENWLVNNPVAKESDVLVIGGGLHGSSSAFHLARRGVSVTVLEADYVGRHASGVNAGGVRTLGRSVPEIPLALMSREIWHDIADTVGDDCG